MPIFRYSDPGGIEEPATLVALSSNVRWGEFALTNGAEVGDVTNSTIVLDDAAGALDLQGLRAFDVRELAAPSNNRVIFRGVVQDRTVSRSTERSALTASARIWSVDLSDYNWHLGKRLLVDQDSNRPAETIGDRLRWLINRAAHININDYGHVTYPSRQMDANDYRLQRPIDVLNDCCIEDNYNFWVDFNEAHGKPELFFIDPSSSTYASSIYISNDMAEVDSSTIFAPYRDATLTRSASRIAFGAAVTYPDGFEYRRKDSTGQQFGKLDQVAPMENVKNATRAGRLAQKFVNNNDEETDVIECSIKVPRAQVNDIRHGHLVGVRFVHLPGYEDWRSVRVLERTVAQEAEGGDTHYLIHLKMTAPLGGAVDASPPEPPFEGSSFAGLMKIFDIAGTSGPLVFDYDGDNPGSGWYPLPGSGPLTPDGSAGAHTGISATEAITVRIELQVGFNSAVNGPQSMTVNLRVNGDVIATDTKSTSTAGPHAWEEGYNLNVPSITLASGDTITADVDGTADVFWTNATNNVYLRVGRGTHFWNSGAVVWVGAS